MKRLPFAALGLALCAVVTVCLAQQPQSTPKSPSPTPNPTFNLAPPPAAAPESAPAKSDAGFDPFAARPVAEAAPASDGADAETLRTELMELLKQKAGMMTADELRSALSQTEQELQELQGSHALLDAKHILQDIVQNHPRTSAARQAQAILANWEPPSDSFRLQ